MSNFELEGWEEINQNGGTVGTGINKAIHKLTVAIFNSGSKNSTQISYLGDKIDKLNINLEESNKSSDKLTKALNRITLAGVVIAGIGVLVAVGNFILDLLNYLKP
jgi:predicted RNase H-like nuclease (RuvC/YqgF family)